MEASCKCKGLLLTTPKYLAAGKDFPVKQLALIKFERRGITLQVEEGDADLISNRVLFWVCFHFRANHFRAVLGKHQSFGRLAHLWAFGLRTSNGSSVNPG